MQHYPSVLRPRTIRKRLACPLMYRRVSEITESAPHYWDECRTGISEGELPPIVHNTEMCSQSYLLKEGLAQTGDRRSAKGLPFLLPETHLQHCE